MVAVDGAALHLQCSQTELSQKELVAVLAETWADKVEADLGSLEGTARVQALARFRSQRHKQSIGMAFINEPMGGASAEFDGLPWQLALKRAVGEEQETEVCNLCRKPSGGTLHARHCQASQVKGHDTIVHNRVKRKLQSLLSKYLRVRAIDEDRTPFIASANENLRMDIVLPADAFPTTGYDGSTQMLPLMVDVTCFEAQSASRMHKTAQDPERCCRDQQAAKQTHYSGHYDQSCYKLATLAVGSFGSMGDQGWKLLDAMAEEYAAREAVPGTARPLALKGIALSRIRASLSATLQMALSARVMAYLSSTRTGGNVMRGEVEDDVDRPGDGW
jgi:hypothetical protein